jgi:monomeric sarcosine oxidase
MTGTHYDVIVAGAGSMGMAAGYFLAKQGSKVLLIDAFDPPHVYGSHHGDTRIIRHAYGEGREYVPLALRAQRLWAELEEEWGKPLFVQTGVLNVGAHGSAFTNEVIASAEQFSLPLEVWSADELNRRWPGMNIPEGWIGCYETTSGVLFSEECIRAFREQSVKRGAALLANTAVENIEIHAQGVIVHTKAQKYFADSLVVSAGAWAGRLLAKLNLPLQPTRKTVAWFEADDSLYGSERFPAFVFHLTDEMYYGFPSFSGCGVKIGRHDGGQKADPDQMNREFGAFSEDEADVRRFLQRFMPQAAGRLKQGRVCIYTMTPDEDFIIDRHPEHPHVAIAAGFSGHGFKFSSAVGEILCQLATTGKTEHQIGKFSLSRFSPAG